MTNNRKIDKSLKKIKKNKSKKGKNKKIKNGKSINTKHP